MMKSGQNGFWPIALGMAMVCGLAGCGQRLGRSVVESTETRFTFEQPQMGVPFRLVMYATNETQAQRAARAAFARIGDLNMVLSDYDTDSELNRLCRTSSPGHPVRVSEDLWRVLRRAQRLARATDGAFDVTVGPYVGLWRKARREEQLPKPALLAQAGERVGWRYLRLHPETRSVELLATVMHLDLGGIAKGYAVDAALDVLRDQGCPRAMVSGGGDLAVGEAPPGKRGWHVLLGSPVEEDQADDDAAREYLWLEQEAVATSGDVFQFLEMDGVRYSHIVDPRTGVGLTNQSQVTVVAPSCFAADGLATAVSVLGPKEGLDWLRTVGPAEARVSWRQGSRIARRATPGFQARVETVAPE